MEESIDGPAIAWFWPIRKEPTVNSDDENDSVPLETDKKAATDDDSNEEDDDDEEQEIEYEVRNVNFARLRFFSKILTPFYRQRKNWKC